MKILGNRLLVRQLPTEAKSGPIFLPDGVRPEQFLHEVVAVGSKVTEELVPGDLVFLSQYDLTDRTEAGENLWIIPIKSACLAVTNQP